MARTIKIDLSNLPEVTNKAYYPLYKNQKRYMVLMGGGSSGKSVFATQKIIYRMLTETPHRFLVVRKVKADLRDSCFAELKNTIYAWGMEGLFDIPRGRSSDLYLRCINGNEIIFYGLDDVEKRKSIQGITGIWIEEASEISVEDFRQLDIRMRGQSKHYKQMILTFNPISMVHWLKAEFFDQQKPDAVTLKTTHLDNKFLPDEDRKVLLSFKDTDPYYYQVYCLGEWGVLGQTVYNAKIVSDRLMQIQAHKPVRGRFEYEYKNERIVNSSIRFVEDDEGPITIYEMPKKLYPYVIGGDTAEGGEDYCTASVRNNVTWNQAATYRERTDTDLYAKQMYCLGKYYNNALIGVEVNFDLHPVKELERLGYTKQFRREVIDEITEKKQHKHGFKTTSLTRPMIISKHVTLARENIETFNDATLLEEMLTFVRNEKGRPEAEKGAHDDMIFADAITLEIREQQRMYTEITNLPRTAPRRRINPHTGY